jgi:Phage virion morphogenesis family
MASVTWDKNLLAAKIANLHGLEGGAFKTTLAQLIAAGGVKLTMDTFRKQADPYGKAWQPLKRERSRDKRARLRRESKGMKARGQKILIKTGRMRNSTTAIQSGSSGGVAIPTGYAASHQNGAHIAPHTRLASYGNVTYRVGNRFASERQAMKARRLGQEVHAGRYNRTFSNGITIPQRMMLPSAERGLPLPWRQMIERESRGLVNRVLNPGVRP